MSSSSPWRLVITLLSFSKILLGGTSNVRHANRPANDIRWLARHSLLRLSRRNFAAVVREDEPVTDSLTLDSMEAQGLAALSWCSELAALQWGDVELDTLPARIVLRPETENPLSSVRLPLVLFHLQIVRPEEARAEIALVAHEQCQVQCPRRRGRAAREQ